MRAKRATFVSITDFFRLPLGQLFVALSSLYQESPCSKWWNAIKFRVLNNADLRTQPSRLFFAKAGIATEHYAKFAMETERADPHAIYPTNIYRQCDGSTIANNDYSTIESVMSTTLTTTIKIRKKVLEVDNDTLSKIYKPLGRCIAIIDDKVFDIYGDQIQKYFDHHDVEFKALVYKGNEVDKEIGNVETILVDLKTHGVSRNEPILIMGGGVISDIGGFACGLYHRSTPYVMLCTSIVSGIDAGPSPRTCCDGFGFKNLYGAYHPPIQTITDRFFFQSLKTGWIRHGIAEIIKMSVTKDFKLFELLEKAGSRLIDTKFGTEMVEDDPDFEDLCDLIIGRALDSYVKSEYGNLWETHQCRPHAYGHTWSPGYELAAGMLHGHAVATGMGFGAFLSLQESWISQDEFKRILNLIATMQLSLWHPIMDDVEMIWNSQVKMVQKRGGNLCAPIPRGSIGICGYLNDLPHDRLKSQLAEYKNICNGMPRQGLGVEVHCSDVGLEDPSVTAKAHIRKEIQQPVKDNLSYNEWIQEVQSERNANWNFNVRMEDQEVSKNPPKYDGFTLFQNDTIENYAMDMTSTPSEDMKEIAKATRDNEMFAPCMVGTLESQFLKMIVQMCGAKKVLDVGTFTGMSALAMAEGLPASGRVVTLEFDAKIAQVAQECFTKSSSGSKIDLRTGCAKESMKQMLTTGEKFDLIFIDADKENYKIYYEFALSGLLAPNGTILADNSLCSLLYDQDDDERAQKLHEFNAFVKQDKRVEQVVLTIREGVSLIRPL